MATEAELETFLHEMKPLFKCDHRSFNALFDLTFTACWNKNSYEYTKRAFITNSATFIDELYDDIAYCKSALKSEKNQSRIDDLTNQLVMTNLLINAINRMIEFKLIDIYATLLEDNKWRDFISPIMLTCKL